MFQSVRMATPVPMLVPDASVLELEDMVVSFAYLVVVVLKYAMCTAQQTQKPAVTLLVRPLPRKLSLYLLCGLSP